MDWKIKLRNEIWDLHIEVPKSAKRIGVMFSGGIDSTLILSLLCLAQKRDDFEITAFTVENSQNYQIHCRAILSLPFFKSVLYTDNISNGARFDGVIKQGIKSVLDKDNIDLVFTGVNSNPPVPMSGAPIRFSAEQINSIPKLRCPFVEVTKDWIIETYYQVPEIAALNLLPLTHSCTAQSLGECGNCFQCKEKTWAFSKIGREYINGN